MLRNLLESTLTSYGYTVLIAEDGEKAVEVYKNRHHEISIVLTDIGLPKLSGQDAFIRMKEVNPDVKVIMVSGYLQPQARTELFEAGAKAVIQKPYMPPDVLKKIREVIQQT
jgi:CheY-like chemotaxis protein